MRECAKKLVCVLEIGVGWGLGLGLLWVCRGKLTASGMLAVAVGVLTYHVACLNAKEIAP